MPIDRVSISFNARPTIKLRGRELDLKQQKVHDVGGQRIKGVKLDANTYLSVSPAKSGKGKYQLTLVSTNGKSLNRWNVKLKGGSVNRVRDRGRWYDNMAPQAKGGSFTFDKSYAKAFHQKAEKKLGDQLRKAGLQFDDRQLKKARKKRPLGRQGLALLSNDGIPLKERKRMFREYLEGKPLPSRPVPKQKRRKQVMKKAPIKPGQPGHDPLAWKAYQKGKKSAVPEQTEMIQMPKRQGNIPVDDSDDDEW